MPSRPWFKFYPADWLGDPLLRTCSMAARAVLIDLICLMEEAEPRGYLLVNGRPPTPRELNRLCGYPGMHSQRMCNASVRQLISKGVLSRDQDGRIFSRRIVRKAQNAEQSRAFGRLGGNPTLKGGVKASGVKPYMLEARSQKLAVRANARTGRGAAFMGERLRVPTFLHDDLCRLKGNLPFDLLAWYPQLDAELVKSGEPIGDELAFVRERFYQAADIKRPNLFGRDEPPERKMLVFTAPTTPEPPGDPTRFRKPLPKVSSPERPIVHPGAREAAS